jgi:hypothetical protein
MTTIAGLACPSSVTMAVLPDAYFQVWCESLEFEIEAHPHCDSFTRDARLMREVGKVLLSPTRISESKKPLSRYER